MALLGGTLAGCVMPQPSETPSASPLAETSALPAVTLPPATPNGTISIGCFLAVQSIVDELRHVDAQISELPVTQQGDVLGPFVDQTQATVIAAPAGCFSDSELAGLEAFWAYADATPPRDLTSAVIHGLLAAVGIPYPTPNP